MSEPKPMYKFDWETRCQHLIANQKSNLAELAHIRAILGMVVNDIDYAPAPSWIVWERDMVAQGWTFDPDVDDAIGMESWVAADGVTRCYLGEAAAYYANGETPPPIEWDDIPFSEDVNDE